MVAFSKTALTAALMAVLSSTVTARPALPVISPRGHIPFFDFHILFDRYNETTCQGEGFNVKEHVPDVIEADGECYRWPDDERAHVAYAFSYAWHGPDWWPGNKPTDFGDCTILSYADNFCGVETSQLSHYVKIKQLIDRRTGRNSGNDEPLPGSTGSSQIYKAQLRGVRLRGDA
ncbi:uncharacterized protein LTR77_009864 [Saxophila tyrrhenica]|uniref:Ecp2 effector protein domain-containing protein n=1 Tax=Saxophila tyrrhenica TaxID=1690608 RepID=A0AAV9P1K0_9PEZI|nr:hypothetical protein LTR77_009864 [Saxophila tyrrhenica]